MEMEANDGGGGGGGSGGGGMIIIKHGHEKSSVLFSKNV